MKIVAFHNAYQNRGGEDGVFEKEIELLRGQGHFVESARASNSSIRGPLDQALTFFNVPYSRRREKWARGLTDAFEADVAHIHNFFPLLTPAIHVGAERAGAAVVQTLHNYRLLCANALFLRKGAICEKCLHGSRAWGVMHRCYRGSAIGSLAVVRMQHRAERMGTWHRHVHRFIALTEFARRKFIEGGLPEDRIVVKPNFVSDPGAPRLETARQGALFVGRLSVEKGLSILLEAWKAFPDVPLTILGDGPEREALERIAPPNVRFVGSVDAGAVRDHMLKSSCLIIPSVWYEGFPMTIVEGFANGLPVVASQIGSLAEIVEDGVNGVHFEAGKPGDLVRKLRELFAAPGRLKTMGREARHTYERLYTPEVNLRQLEKIYADAIDLSRSLRR